MPKRVTHKNTDSKGRLTLGEAFANQTWIVEHREHEIVLQPARVIPAREAWLYEDEAALSAVRDGLQQARRGELEDGPNLDAARRLADELGTD